MTGQRAGRPALLLLMVMLVGTACGDDDDASTDVPETLVPSRRPPELEAGCADYEGAFTAWANAPGTPEDDVRFADELDAISAASASGTALEAPLREMASEFRAGQLNVDGGTITDLCAGNQPETPSEAEAQARASYLTRVRAEAPDLIGIADDDLVEAGDQVCTVLGTDPTLNADSDNQRYLILTGIANTAMGHDDETATGPAVQAAADAFCPEQSATVAAILASG